MNVGYHIIKNILLDVSDYIHSGLTIDDVEMTIASETYKHKGCIYKQIPNLLMYEVVTTMSKDEDVKNMAEDIVNKLDIKLVEEKINEGTKNN